MGTEAQKTILLICTAGITTGLLVKTCSEQRMNKE